MLLRPRAVSPLLALIAAAIAVSGGSARAQENDPFALPKGVTVKAVEQAAGPGCPKSKSTASFAGAWSRWLAETRR